MNEESTKITILQYYTSFDRLYNRTGLAHDNYFIFLLNKTSLILQCHTETAVLCGVYRTTQTVRGDTQKKPKALGSCWGGGGGGDVCSVIQNWPCY